MTDITAQKNLLNLVRFNYPTAIFRAKNKTSVLEKAYVLAELHLIDIGAIRKIDGKLSFVQGDIETTVKI